MGNASTLDLLKSRHAALPARASAPLSVVAGSKTALLLSAACRLKGSFTPSDLAVAAWRLWPKRFGMKGYEKYHPDLNAVLTYLVGKRGMVASGRLRRVEPGRYAVTPLGRGLAEKHGGTEGADREMQGVRDGVAGAGAAAAAGADGGVPAVPGMPAAGTPGGGPGPEGLAGRDG